MKIEALLTVLSLLAACGGIILALLISAATKAARAIEQIAGLNFDGRIDE